MKRLITLGIASLFFIPASIAQCNGDCSNNDQGSLNAYNDSQSKQISTSENQDYEIEYFPYESDFRVKAKFTKLTKEKIEARDYPEYVVYGVVEFDILGKHFLMNLYQSDRMIGLKEFDEDLFLAFTDFTSGNESYGGGRFINLKFPEGNEVLLDFNKAFNPNCAYSYEDLCPAPPRENDMAIAIKAGAKAPKE